MAQPPAYNITTDFSATPGQDRIPAASLDVELQNLQTTIAALRTNIALIQRDDGALRDAIVTSASLSTGLLSDLIQQLAGYAPQAALVEVQTATEGQTAFTLTQATYTPGVNNLAVYVQGVRQFIGIDYAETSSSVVTFTSGQTAGTQVAFTIDERGVDGDVVDSANVAFTQSGTGAQASNVRQTLRYDKRIYAESFGVVADDSADDAAALNAALAEALASKRELVLPEGTMKIDSGLTVATGGGYTDGVVVTGRGMYASIIRPTGNFTALTLDGSGVNSQFMMGGRLADFAIVPSSAGGASQHGLSLKSWWFGDISKVRLQSLGGSGIYVPLDTGISTNPDLYATIGLNVNRCRIAFNNGWGVYAPVGLGFGGPIFELCQVGENKLGGYYLAGHSFELRRGSCFSNGKNGVSDGPGLMIDSVQTSPQVFRIEGVEFDNNRTAHIHIKAGRGFEVVCNRMNSWETVFNDGVLSPPIHVLVGGAGNAASNGRLTGNQHRSQRSDAAVPASTMHALTLYDFSNDSNAANNEVLNPNADALDNTTAMTLFSGFNLTARNDAELSTRLHHSGHMTGYARARITVAENIEASAAKIVFDSDQFDPHSLYASGTYTVPYTGIFHVSYALRVSGVADGTLVTISARTTAGAGTSAENQHRVNGTGSQTLTGSMSCYLQAGDDLELWGSNSSGSAIAITTGTTASWVCINGGR